MKGNKAAKEGPDYWPGLFNSLRGVWSCLEYN